jgi:C1A family cysteine protease
MNKYRWLPDTPDHRDMLYTIGKGVRSILPDYISPLGTNNRVENQGTLGSCTGNAVTSMIEIKLGLDRELSRMFAYYNGRSRENTAYIDSGCQIRSVIKAATKLGICSETTWPYKVQSFNKYPSQEAYVDALKLVEQIKKAKLKYLRVLELDELLRCLATIGPVAFGFAVPASFESLPKNGLLKLPKKKEPSLGGHAVLAVGYDMKKETRLYFKSCIMKMKKQGEFSHTNVIERRNYDKR